ncbi:hypothetical protein [Streptosporangium sp. KLBMP 9127]|nr:hypothetical protein [Streptosporangium sp. KLBMP 9127]
MFQLEVESAAREVRVPYLAVFSRSPGSGHDELLKTLMPQARSEIYQSKDHFPYLIDVPRFTRSIRTLEM